jgi:hypothetical protein
MRKLSDAELADRVRTRNTRRTTAYRERLTQAGKVQLAVWIPGELRNQIDTAAGLNSRTLSAECTELLREGFEYRELSK